MRIRKTKNFSEVKALIQNLNFCHDSSLRKICFIKKRSVDKKDGSLIYPFDNIEELINCDIEMELILNSYLGAKKDQIIILSFKDVKSFKFMQNGKYDYSDIYELKAIANKYSNADFHFYSTKEKIESLIITCSEFICKEK